jgi:hypothetical protein
VIERVEKLVDKVQKSQNHCWHCALTAI